MNEKPGVQPMMQTHLEIEHAALVAPVLNLFNAAPIGFGDAKLHETKGVFGKTRIVQAHAIAASRAQIGQNLSIDKLDQDGLGLRIGR